MAMAFAGVSRQSVNSQILKYIFVMLMIGIICLLIAIIVASGAANKMAEAVSLMNGSIMHLVQNEYVKIDKYLNRGDEIGQALNDTNTLVDTLHDMRLQFNSIAGIFITVHEIDLSEDTFSEVQCNNEQLGKVVGKSGAMAGHVIRALTEDYTDPGSRDSMLDFVDLKLLNERLAQRQMISEEFMDSDRKWRRARFVVSDRSETGQVRRVMFLTEDIDMEKRGIASDL